LPPATRTVGQVVAEAIRLYQANWVRALAIGVLPAIVGVVTVELGGWRSLVFGAAVGSVVYTASYVVACGIVGGVPLRAPQALTAFVAGVLVFLPVPFLAIVMILPALVWLAFVGLVVPVALIEALPLRRSFSRALELARADYVHVLGGLATLAILTLVSQGVVAFSLREFSDQTERLAAVLASIVLAPLLFLGAAVLYEDQEARRSARRSEAGGAR
jgi:hypothetical protein